MNGSREKKKSEKGLCTVDGPITVELNLYKLVRFYARTAVTLTASQLKSKKVEQFLYRPQQALRVPAD